MIGKVHLPCRTSRTGWASSQSAGSGRGSGGGVPGRIARFLSLGEGGAESWPRPGGEHVVGLLWCPGGVLQLTGRALHHALPPGGCPQCRH